MLRSRPIGKQSGNQWSQSGRRKKGYVGKDLQNFISLNERARGLMDEVALKGMGE